MKFLSTSFLVPVITSITVSVVSTLITLHFRSAKQDANRPQFESFAAKPESSDPISDIIKQANNYAANIHASSPDEYVSYFVVNLVNLSCHADTASRFPVTKADVSVSNIASGFYHASVRARTFGNPGNRTAIDPIELELLLIPDGNGNYVVTSVKKTYLTES